VRGLGGGGGVPGSAAGDRVELPGVLSAALFTNLDLAREVLGASLPEGTIELVRTRVGLPVLVEARLQHEQRTLRATKRVLVSERLDGNVNPPPPRFMFGDELVIGDEHGLPFTCAAASGRVLVVPPGSDVKLAPVVHGQRESWLQSYQIIDARGDLQDRTETAFYSWYVTAGEISPGTTKAPDRAATWSTPAEPGDQRVWVIVRDGHGGVSACGLQVSLEGAQNADSRVGQ
jgi:hypothetical protein